MSTHQAFRNKDSNGIHIIHNGAISTPRTGREKGVLYTFDEGGCITQDEGTLGIIVIGGLGRGKTASFIMPMAQAMIEDGLGGLIVDVKNNMTPQVMALAKHAEREGDIVELGTHPSAHPINILSGISLSEIEQMISALCLTGMEHAHNVEWIYEGVLLSKDVAFVLHNLAKADPLFTPSLALISRCLSDHEFARTIFRQYRTSAHDSADYAQRAFVERVRNDPFHLFSKKEHRTKSEHHRQLGFRLAFCRTAFAQVTSDETLLTNFSSPSDAFEVDYRDFIAKGKIVLLRFKSTQGRAALLLAKILKEKFYRDVYRLLDEGDGPRKPFFFVADEFQDVIDIDQNNAFDDFSWFSKAREFGCVNIVATQALSSLYGHVNKELVNALVSNCSTKIFMQNDDPAADTFVRHFIGVERTLSQLKHSEALVSRFDLSTRCQQVAHLHCSRSFMRTQNTLEKVGLLGSPKQYGQDITERMERIDGILVSCSLKEKHQRHPHYLKLIDKFQDVLAQDKVRLDYPVGMQDVVLEILCEYRRLFLKESSLSTDQRITGVGWVDGQWLYLDLPPTAPQENEQFQREVLEL